MTRMCDHRSATWSIRESSLPARLRRLLVRLCHRVGWAVRCSASLDRLLALFDRIVAALSDRCRLAWRSDPAASSDVASLPLHVSRTACTHLLLAPASRPGRWPVSSFATTGRHAADPSRLLEDDRVACPATPHSSTRGPRPSMAVCPHPPNPFGASSSSAHPDPRTPPHPCVVSASAGSLPHHDSAIQRPLTTRILYP